MKTIIISILLICLLMPGHSQEFCDPQLVDNIKYKLDPEVKYLTSFQAFLEDAQGAKEYPVKRFEMVFSKGNLYNINVFSSKDYPGDAIIKLYHDDRIIGSSYNSQANINHGHFNFICQQTGKYAIEITTADGKEACAVGVLSFVSRVYTVVIDPGHGGKDPGAEVPDKAIEKDIVLSLAQILQDKVKPNPEINFIFTREKDEFLEIEKRVQKVKKAKADLLISIHVNTSPLAGKSGIECYVAKNSNHKEHSKSIAYTFINEFKQLDGIDTYENAREVNFKILKDSPCPSILLDIGYLSNPNNLAFLKNTQNLELICDKILNSIDKIKE